MNTIIIGLIIYYILLLILYEYTKTHTLSLIFIISYLSLSIGCAILFFKYSKHIKGGVTFRDIRGSNEQNYIELNTTITDIMRVTDLLSQTQKEIDIEIQRLQKVEKKIPISFSSVKEDYSDKLEVEYTTFSTTPSEVQLEKAIPSKFQKLDILDPYISKCIQKSKKEILYYYKNPLEGSKWKLSDDNIYIHQNKELRQISEDDINYFLLSYILNKKEKIFPDIYALYENDKKIYIEMEHIPRTLESILLQEIPEKEIKKIETSETNKMNILKLYKRKLPISTTSQSLNSQETSILSFDKKDYISFIDRIQKEYTSMIININTQLKQHYKYMMNEKWTYGGFLCKDIGILENNRIVLMHPNKLIYDPLHQAYTDYILQNYSIDGIYNIRILQVPLKSSTSSSNIFNDVLQMQVKL